MWPLLGILTPRIVSYSFACLSQVCDPTDPATCHRPNDQASLSQSIFAGSSWPEPGRSGGYLQAPSSLLSLWKGIDMVGGRKTSRSWGTWKESIRLIRRFPFFLYISGGKTHIFGVFPWTWRIYGAPESLLESLPTIMVPLQLHRVESWHQTLGIFSRYPVGMFYSKIF